MPRARMDRKTKTTGRKKQEWEDAVAKCAKPLELKGLKPYRLKSNPKELEFAEAWARMNQTGSGLRSHGILAYILGHERPEYFSDRDEQVAATVVQWLGTPVGQNFLGDLGYQQHAAQKEVDEDEDR